MTTNKMAQRYRTRNWVFTDFELIDWETVYNNQSNIRYITYGEEKCPSSGNTHYQGWIQLENPKELNWVKKHLHPTAHWEAMKKNSVANNKYCHKDGDYKIFGKYKTQGQRTDLERIQDEIKGGATLFEIADNNFETFCKYRSGITKYHEMAQNHRTSDWRDVEVIVLTGETGTGKTREAMKEAKYKIQGEELEWWDRYEGEECILIDEYDTNVTITKMLSLLDGYKLRLAVKGGFTYANWNKVYITSNVQLSDWHPQAKMEHRKALYRRINKVINYTWNENGNVDIDERIPLSH